MAIDSWSLVRVFGTWVNHGGAMIAGKYTIRVPVRLTNSADDLIIPAGVFATGDLNVTPGVPSLSIECPATDDPDIQQDGWKLTVEVTFTPGQAKETYVIDVPMADRPVVDGGTGAGVNLRTIALSANLPPQVAMYGVGRPLGLAVLSEDGTAVLDAFGDPITGSGGGVADWDTITDKPAVIAAGATAAEARTAIGAGTSSLALGTTGSTAAAGNDSRLTDQRTPTDGSVTNVKVDAAAGITLDKTADSAASGGRLAMTTAERSKLSGIAASATANATDSALRDRSTHTGTQTASTISDFAAAAQAAAPAETTLTIGGVIAAATAKTPVDADMLAVADPAGSNAVKKVTWANLKATLKTYLDTLYATVTHSHAAADIASGTLAIGRIPTGTTSSTVALGNDARLSDARTPVAHSAALVTSGNLDVARNTASIPHDAWQASGGTWPARPSVPSGARVNWIGYPGLTDAPAAMVTGTDSYMPRTA